jgi:hypothetical protein
MPEWLLRERETSMRVDDQILNCTGFIGTPTELGGFSVWGTGFFVCVYEEAFGFAYFVTARHVVWPDSSRRGVEGPPQGDIFIRVNKSDGSGTTPLKSARSEWLFHDDRLVDLCALPFLISSDLDKDGHDVGILNTEMFYSVVARSRPNRIGIGDEVFITGAFVGRVGERKNIPVVRVGNIAAMPLEPIDFGSPRHPAYLIETRSLGGISGSPVFVNLFPNAPSDRSAAIKKTHPQRGEETLFPYAVVGMVLGAHGGHYAPDFALENDADIHPPKDADFNSGISVVMPDSEIEKFLLSPKVAKGRQQAMEERRRQSGYFTASAPSKSEPPTTEDNPTHAEDFRRLLNAAAKTPSQGGGT